ncbi:amidohydrolase [uncultured Megasphaera sp.]|uniref:amidohydrolase n=1 Tax=uncultured Megasphaera sp. TaxID=165188 RepID=UPI0025968104|nr:amidohydrolase [uncultured Megasphaera sp.]
MNTSRSLPFSVSEAVRQTLPYMMEIREYFHAHPESGHHEFDTCKTLFQELTLMGVSDVKIIAGTGVTGIIHGSHPGSVLLLRAAIDALPLHESPNSAYASLTSGLMHASGHDGEMAMLLGIAKIFCKYKKQLHGSIRFVFEPAVSTTGSALKMIDAGILYGPKPDIALSCRFTGGVPLGTVAFQDGNVSPYADLITLTISQPENQLDPTINPLNIGNKLLYTIHETLLGHINVAPDTLIFNHVYGGTTATIIPEKTTFEGVLRTSSPNTSHHIIAAINDMIQEIMKTTPINIQLHSHPIASALSNDKALCAAAKKTWQEHLPTLQFSTLIDKRRIDDFSYIAEQIPSFTYDIGVRTDHDLPINTSSFIWESSGLKLICTSLLTLVQYLPEYLSAET